MSKNDKDLSYAGWVRSVMLRTPTLTLEQLQAEHDKSHWAKQDRPKDKQQLYAARNILCQRWGLKKVEDLPRNQKGDLNLTAMIRLYLKKYGVKSEEPQARAFFAKDGLELASSVFFKIRKEESNGKSDSPDENQNAGPRAGKPKEGRKKSKRAKKNGKTPMFDLPALLSAKRFIEEVGGVETARSMIEVITALQTLPK